MVAYDSRGNPSPGWSDCSFSSDVANRLHNHSKETEAKRMLLQQHLRELETKENRDPSINPLSKKLNRKLDSIFRWNELKMSHIKELARQQQEAELSQVVSQPKINPKSQQMAQSRCMQKVEDRLLTAGIELKAKKEVNRRKERLRAQFDATPLISSYSANIARVGDIHERLFLEHKDKSRRKKEMCLRFDQTPPNETNSKVVVPRVCRPTPTNTNNNSGINSEPVHERLLRQGEIDKQRKEEMLRIVTSTEESQRLVSQYIGPYSTLLNQLVERRTNTPARERATSPTSGSWRRQCGEAAQEDPNATFHPYVSELSRAIDTQKHGPLTPTQRVDILYMKKSEADARLRRLQMEKSMEETRELKGFPVSHKKASASGVSRQADMDFHQKNILWKKRIETRRQREQRQKELEKLAECTFHPNLDPKRSESPITRSQTPPPRWTYDSSSGSSRNRSVSPRATTPPPTPSKLKPRPSPKTPAFVGLLRKGYPDDIALVRNIEKSVKKSKSSPETNSLSQDDVAYLISKALHPQINSLTKDLNENPRNNRNTLIHETWDAPPREWQLPISDDEEEFVEEDEEEDDYEDYEDYPPMNSSVNRHNQTNQRVPTIGDIVSQALSSKQNMNKQPSPTATGLKGLQPIGGSKPKSDFITDNIPETRVSPPHDELLNSDTQQEEDDDYDDDYIRQREELIKKIEETRLQLAKEQEGLMSMSDDEVEDKNPQRRWSEEGDEEEEETPEYLSFLRAQQESQLEDLE